MFTKFGRHQDVKSIPENFSNMLKLSEIVLPAVLPTDKIWNSMYVCAAS